MDIVTALESLRDEFAIKAAMLETSSNDALKLANALTEALDKVIAEAKAGE